MNRRQFLKGAAGTGGALLLLACYSIFIERYLVRFSRYLVPVPKLPPEFEGLKIVHLTDLHYGFLVPLPFLAGIFGRILKLDRDLIVCTGDYVHERNKTDEIERLWPHLAELHAPMGVYSVLGNHDHWADTDRSFAWLERSGQGVRGKALPLTRGGSRLWIAGAGDYWSDRIDLGGVLRQIPDDECRIVLAHNPDSADEPFTERIDLTLSGHTHGGQVNIPLAGPPVLPVKNKNYSAGLVKSTKNESVFISRGIGWAIYPVRFNCFPEVPTLVLTAA